MPNTHYLALVGEVHVRGNRTSILPMDRMRGRYIRLIAAPSPAPTINEIVRGGSSNNVARVVQILGPTEFILEAYPNTTPLLAALGVSGAAFSQNSNMGLFPFSGETLTFDGGGTGQLAADADAQLMPYGRQFLEQLQDSDLRGIPADLSSDTVWWDRGAQVSREFRMTTASLTGPAPQFKPGDRCTVPGGGAFTVQAATVVGSDLRLRVYRVTGTVTSGQVVTNTTTGANQGTLSQVNAPNPQGIWVPYHPMPNLDSAGSFYERPPLGNATDRGLAGIGPEAKLLPAMADYWAKQLDPADRGVRMVSHSSLDDDPATGLLGGVSIQVVRCTGTFPSTWQVGEVVTGGGGWSAVVHGFNAGSKFLFVRKTNGAVLTAGSVTGGTSGAVGTADGAAFGWQKGSRHWNNWMAQLTAASTAPPSDNSFGGIVGTAPAKFEGLFSVLWEAELNVLGQGSPFPTDAQAQEEWGRWAFDARAQLGNPDMRIVVWMNRLESQSDTVFLIPPGVIPEFPNGVPASLRLRQWMGLLPQLIPNLTVIDSEVEGYRMARVRAASPLPGVIDTPETDSTQWLRPLDYYQLGADFFRYWIGGQVEVLPGNGYTPLPVGILIGQSNATGYISAGTAIAFDQDPELYPHSNFAPGLSTIDGNALAWNFRTHAIEPYDISVTGNGSFGTQPGTCGSDPPLVQRSKMRFSSDPDNSFPFALFKCTVPGSSANRDVIDSFGCWDPDLSTRTAVSVNATVTTFAATSTQPARGRFTAAAAGTFTESVWQVGMSATITGSALGNAFAGGNNTTPYNILRVHAIAGDGSWIEFAGVFAPEASRPFTFTAGPPPIWPYFVQEWRRFIGACKELGYVPHPVWAINIQGESDLMLVDGYQAALTRIWNALIAECDIGAKLKGRTQMAKIQVLTHLRTGWPVDDTAIATQRAAQIAVMAGLQNAKTLDVSDLSLELRTGIFPRTQREDNGVHLTGRGFITQGFRLDALLATMTGIPPHPNGELALDFGAVQGGVALSAPFVAPEFRSAGTPGTGGLIVEDGSGIDDANSMCSVEQFRQFWADNGGTQAITDATDAEIAVVLRRATREWHEGVCGGLWRGNVQYQTQRLSWPRVGCHDDEGRLVRLNTVPWQIPEAVAIVAGDMLLGGSILTNSVERGPIVRETKRGLGFEQTFEYGDSFGSSQSIRRIRSAEALVATFVRGGGAGVARS